MAKRARKSRQQPKPAKAAPTSNRNSAPDNFAHSPASNSNKTDTPWAAGETYLPPEKRSLWPSEIFESAMRPCNIVPRNWKRELPHLAAVFVAALFLYAWTAPRLVALEDDGLFIANLHFFGVAHPPGYPAHTFFGGLFYHILDGLQNILGWEAHEKRPAYLGHLFSGFAGAVACSALYATVAMLIRGRVFAYFAGLGYAASDTFWSQAIITEVYTLNSMFFFIVLALCLRYSSQALGHLGQRSTKTHRHVFIALTFVYGLGVANHYPLLGLGSIGLGMMVLSQIGNIIPRAVLGVAGVFAGAAPLYLWMVWRSGYKIAENPANFYGPIGLLGINENISVVDFWFYFRRSGYSGVDKQSGVGLEDKLDFATDLGHDMLWQFTPLGFALVVVGVLVMLRSRYNWLGFSLLTSWFMTSFLLVLLLDFKAEFIWKAAFRVYHLLAFGIMAIWLAFGAAWIADKTRSWLSPMMRRQLGGAMLAAVVGFSLATHWNKNDRSGYSWAHDLAVAKLNSVEAGAVLFTFDDLDLPVGYLHFVEGQRPDLKVYNDQALVYGDRLYSPLLPDNPPPNNPGATGKTDILRKFIGETNKPIYYHAARENLYRHPRYGSDFLGFFRRVNREGPHQRIILSDYLRDWLDKNAGLHNEITDLWTRQQHYSTVSQLVSAVQVASYNGVQLSEEWNEVIERAISQNTLARLTSNSNRLNFRRLTPELMRRELDWMNEFDPSSQPLLGRGVHADFYWQKAFFARELQDENTPFEDTLLLGWRANQTPNNRAAVELLNFYQAEERFCDFIAMMAEIYPNAADIPKPYLPGLRAARQSAGNCPPAEAA